ncbi:surface-adhesin E family protein, partial [Staphylococcus equorum]|uniref:surface-adhesin E family protein n=1 Tax=Staphylococcus equorum TaxID=246432 RepID=UPI0022AEA20D
PAKPPGVFKLVETADLITYFSAKSLTLYDNNPHLRQFYLINNYKQPLFVESLKQTISSSRATRVINCERDEVTHIERVYFSEP